MTVLAARETMVIGRAWYISWHKGLSTPDPSLSPAHLSIRRGRTTTTHFTHHQVSLMVTRNTTLVPSLGLRTGPACEAGLSAGMRRERVPPQKIKIRPLMGGLLGLHLVQRGRDRAGPQPAHAPPRCTYVTAHRSTASVPIAILLYPLLCSFNVGFKGLNAVFIAGQYGYNGF